MSSKMVVVKTAMPLVVLVVVALSTTPIQSFAPASKATFRGTCSQSVSTFDHYNHHITNPRTKVLSSRCSISSSPHDQNDVTALRRSTLTSASSSSSTTSLGMGGVEGDFDPEAISKAKEDVSSGSIKARLRALYKFTRPHTIRGTILASIAGTVRALVDTPGALTNANWGTMLPRAFMGMVALLLGNAFIVGINQIYDKEIDEMNKPFLPVASGEMSKRSAWVTVVTSCVAGPLIVKRLFPPLLFKLYTFGLFLGGIYSIPPIRTKQNPVLAGLTIACVRGFLLNFGVYYAVKDAIGAPFAWSPKVSFIARFMTAFATVIAVTKDLPDIEGDRVRKFFAGGFSSLFV